MTNEINKCRRIMSFGSRGDHEVDELRKALQTLTEELNALKESLNS